MAARITRRRPLPAVFRNQGWTRNDLHGDSGSAQWELGVLQLAYGYVEGEKWTLWHADADTMVELPPAKLLPVAVAFLLTGQWPTEGEGVTAI